MKSLAAWRGKFMGTPANPESDEGLLYFKADGKLYKKVGGVESLVEGGMPGAGTAPDTYYLTSTGTPITGTAPFIVPGLSQTITSTGPSDLWLVDVSLDISCTTSGATNVSTLNVDGAANPSQIIYNTATGLRAENGKKYRITGLAAGNHTIDVRSYNTTTGASYTIQAAHSIMCIEKQAMIGNLSALAAYPVGSIYFNINSTNPSSILGGGTWAAWGTGRMPVGVDVNQTEFNTVEKTGGAKTVSLTAAQNGQHSHGSYQTNGYAIGGATVASYPSSAGTPVNGAIADSGSGLPHENLSPYITVYMWKRIT